MCTKCIYTYFALTGMGVCCLKAQPQLEAATLANLIQVLSKYQRIYVVEVLEANYRQFCSIKLLSSCLKSDFDFAVNFYALYISYCGKFRSIRYLYILYYVQCIVYTNIYIYFYGCVREYRRNGESLILTSRLHFVLCALDSFPRISTHIILDLVIAIIIVMDD